MQLEEGHEMTRWLYWDQIYTRWLSCVFKRYERTGHTKKTQCDV